MNLNQLHDWLSDLDIAISCIPSGFSISLAVVHWQSEWRVGILVLSFVPSF